MITLRQLEFAVAVGKHKHFKRASEECSVSQSALSLGIAALEEQLDVQVFERNNKQVLITPIGEEIIARANVVLSQVHDLTQLAQSQHKPLNAPMHIGLIPTIAPYLLPKVMPQLRDEFPDFQLHISEDQSERLIEKVRSGVLDTAILALPYPISGLHQFEFWQENFFAVFHEHDAIAKQKKISNEQLTATNLLLLGEGHCLTDHVLSVCHLEKNEGNSSFAHASLNTLIQMSLSNMGTTLVPEMALDQVFQQNSGVTALEVDEAGPHRRIAFITRLNYARVNEIERLASIFNEVLKGSIQRKNDPIVYDM